MIAPPCAQFLAHGHLGDHPIRRRFDELDADQLRERQRQFIELLQRIHV
jgi:hypothetical protein